ncbi:MAG: class I SAM-dependent methyltransferase [Deltaproteobacteria bacterium]|nr:class I SAM-dependent methyltransferase [Deltaproteobacteria bacterium]
MIIDKEELTLVKILALANLENRKVLEIGCGDGRITKGLLANSGSLIAIDPDSAAISTAKERIPEVDFRVGSGESLGFLNDCFDVVLFTLSLHHQNSSKALKEAAKVLNDDGQILIVEPVADSEISIICDIIESETDALNNAINAINTSMFKVVFAEEFYPEWEFENNRELYSWLFDHYQIPYDKSKVVRINKLLGDKKRSRPINLGDKHVIISLVIDAD